MNPFFKKYLKTFFVLFCISCLFLLGRCSDGDKTTGSSNKPSIESSTPSSTEPPQTEQPAHNGTIYSTSSCPICGGSGLCPLCGGQGRTYIGESSGFEDGYVDCPGCHGSGRCWGCNGTGLDPFHN